METMDKVYYVYAYLRSKDSRRGAAGSPYYIGKGKGDRAYDKNHNVSVPRNRDLIVFLGKDMIETDSHQAEMLLIRLWGRIDSGTGVLYNRTDGGEGPSGCVASESTRKKLSMSHRREDISDSDIVRLYFDNKQSISQVGVSVGASGSTVRLRLKKLKLPRRSLSASIRGRSWTPETLQKRSQSMMKYFSSYGSREKASASIRRKDIDDNKLAVMYFEELKSLGEIGEALGILSSTVWRRLKKSERPLRSLQEAWKVTDFRTRKTTKDRNIQ